MATTKSTEKQPEVKKQTFTITEDQVNVLLGAVAKIPWEQANPIIKFVQESLVPVKD